MAIFETWVTVVFATNPDCHYDFYQTINRRLANHIPFLYTLYGIYMRCNEFIVMMLNLLVLTKGLVGNSFVFCISFELEKVKVAKVIFGKCMFSENAKSGYKIL